MTRYFRAPESGYIRVARDAEDAVDCEGRHYTEVKVVPLDAVVIEGPLPEVVFDGAAYQVAGRGHYIDPDNDADEVTRHALGLLAIAAHLRERPPVDQEQLNGVAAILRDIYLTGDVSQDARRLVERGVRVGGDSDV